MPTDAEVQAQALLNGILATFGIRSGASPIFNEVVDGPFVAGGIPNVGGMLIASAQAIDADIPLIRGTSPGFFIDPKLRGAGVTATAGVPTGALLLDGIGGEIAVTTQDMPSVLAALSEFSLYWLPQSGQRFKSVPLINFVRVFNVQTTTKTDVTYGGSGSTLLPMYRLPGGYWPINLQNDTFTIRNTSGGTSVTLAASLQVAFRARGVYVPQATASALGLLQVPACANPQEAAALIAARATLQQVSGGGGDF